MTLFFSVVCLSLMLWAIFCSEFNIIGGISSKMNVLYRSITHSVQQPPRFDICRNAKVICLNIRSV